MSLLENLKWRYATKKMNGTPVEESKVEAILEATRHSASSFGLQPYQIVLVKDSALKEKLSPASYNQPQIKDCSHLLVFCIWDDIHQEHIDNFIQDISKQRNTPLESLENYKTIIANSLLILLERTRISGRQNRLISH